MREEGRKAIVRNGKLILDGKEVNTLETNEDEVKGNGSEWAKEVIDLERNNKVGYRKAYDSGTIGEMASNTGAIKKRMMSDEKVQQQSKAQKYKMNNNRKEDCRGSIQQESVAKFFRQSALSWNVEDKENQGAENNSDQSLKYNR